MKELPYFKMIEKNSRAFLDRYESDQKLVNQLCYGKRDLLQNVFGYNVSRLTQASLLNMPQNQIASGREIVNKS